MTKASLVLKQEIVREGIPIFRLQAQCVLLSMSGRLLRLPAAIAGLFSKAGEPGL